MKSVCEEGSSFSKRRAENKTGNLGQAGLGAQWSGGQGRGILLLLLADLRQFKTHQPPAESAGGHRSVRFHPDFPAFQALMARSPLDFRVHTSQD